MQRGSAFFRSFLRLSVIVLALACPATSFADTAEADSEIARLQKKAREGDAESAFLLGNAYDAGNGVAADPVAAQNWWRKAAELSHREASYLLASKLLRDHHPEEALTWLVRAADLGHPQALGNLGYLYEQGQGVPKNLRMAYSYYLQAADLGLAEAMWNLANMYGSGQYLGESDMMQGCIWSRRSARFAGEKEDALRELLGKITPLIEQSLDADELQACRRIADEWKPSPASSAPPAKSK